MSQPSVQRDAVGSARQALYTFINSNAVKPNQWRASRKYLKYLRLANLEAINDHWRGGTKPAKGQKIQSIKLRS